MYSRHRRKVKLLFGLFDVLLTALAFALAYATRARLGVEQLVPLDAIHPVFYIALPVQALLLLVYLVIWTATGNWLEVYERLDSPHPIVILRDTFRQCALATASLVLFEYALRMDLSRLLLAIFAVYEWTLLCLFRLNAGNLAGFIRREFGAPHFVMVAGVGPSARRLGEALERSASDGVRLLGFLSEDPAAAGQTVELGGAYAVHSMGELPALLREQVIDEILFAVDSRRLADLEEAFLLCDEEGVRTRVVVDFFPHVNSDVYLDRLGNATMLTFAAAPHDEVRLLLKRAIDVALAAAALVLLAPAMAVIALLIRLTSPGPAIFRQQRCGLNGRRFVFYKFRSMCANAEELKPALAHLNHKETAFKIPNDPRLTRIGRYLRKFSIDEWPQLWNVLRGDMSLVGPRPAVPEEVERYQRWQRRRLRMRPGLTCLWAIAGRDALDFETWMRLDMQYIDSWSLALDWKIMLRTVPRVLSGKGAY